MSLIDPKEDPEPKVDPDRAERFSSDGSDLIFDPAEEERLRQIDEEDQRHAP